MTWTAEKNERFNNLLKGDELLILDSDEQQELDTLEDEFHAHKRKGAPLPQMEDLHGINITNGMDSVEYIRRMRDG
jgi:hypothetical protein